MHFNLSTNKWRFFNVESLGDPSHKKHYIEGDMTEKRDIELLASSVMEALEFKSFSNTIAAFNIRHLSKKGYDLSLMSECDLKRDSNGQEARVPAKGKFYLDEEGHYILRDNNNKIWEGTLNPFAEKENIDLTGLKDKWLDFDFKKDILIRISQQTGIPQAHLVNDLDIKINMNLNEKLFSPLISRTEMRLIRVGLVPYILPKKTRLPVPKN